MAQYATSFDRAGGYSFDEASIRDLWGQIQRFAGQESQVEVTLEGDQRIIVREVAELFEDEFIRRNFIEQISISGHRYVNPELKRVSISLRNASFRSAVSMSISGEREECTAVRVEIENILAARRVWYARFFEGTSSIYTIQGFLTAVCSIGVGYYYSQLTNSNLVWAVIVALVVTTVILSTLRSWAEKIMFPKLVFEFGRSASLGERAKFWRNTIGIGFVLAVVAGVIATLLVEWANAH